MGNSIKRKRVDGLCGPKETVQSNQIMKLIWFVAVSAESSQRQAIHNQSTPIPQLNSRNQMIWFIDWCGMDWLICWIGLAKGGPSPQRKQIKFNWKWICLISFVGQWARAAIQLHFLQFHSISSALRRNERNEEMSWAAPTNPAKQTKHFHFFKEKWSVVCLLSLPRQRGAFRESRKVNFSFLHSTQILK